MTAVATTGSVRALLEQELRTARVSRLEMACIAVADQPLDTILAELDQILAHPLPGEAGWRLQVLVSVLYHHAGATLALTRDLRARIQAAQSTTRKGA